ncbi:MAG TPA: cytochrome P450 [Deltaproteobacteria bacterium]|nr:cytochrome P450 [Deltaproteobacteria bacterium]
MAANPASDAADFRLVHPEDYAAFGYPHHVWTRLRAEDPVSWQTQPGEALDYWAITKHADITEIGKRPDVFLSAPRIVIQHIPEEPRDIPPTLIQMDPPMHGAFRQQISRRFTPRMLKKIHDPIERIGREIVEKLYERGDEGECDFVAEVSAPLPIAVIAWLLGVPECDWNMLFDWTNRSIGAGDPEFQDEGRTARETAEQAQLELFGYFSQLIAERRKNPADDLVTVFTRAEYEGRLLDDMEVLAWCFIIVIAGNETTRNGTTGGMLAFIEHPDQLRRVQQDMGLLDSAIEEVVRWTTPIIHFGRTAARDYPLRDKVIREGDAVALFYPSANRDEEIFEDPFEFRVDRRPNRHLGFGVGEHFCLGAHLARLEMHVAYKYLLPRIAEIELSGPVDRLHSGLVGGLKRLPIHYKLRPMAA